MAGADRDEDRRLSFFGEIERRPWALDFYHAMRRIEGLYPELPRLGEARRPADEPVRLGQDPELTFAPANLARVDLRGELPRILVRFLGLWGPQGPLPLHLTEFAHERVRNYADPTLARFADVFHHRLLLGFYRAWRMAQPTASRDRQERDRFRVYVGSVFGMGTPALASRDTVPDDSKRFFGGTLARAAPNPDGLADVMGVYLQLPVKVKTFAPRWMALPREQRSRLGRGGDAARLGVGAVLGARVYDAQHHFSIRIGPAPLAAYEQLLPGAAWQVRVRDWVRTYVGEEYGVRATLSLHAREVPEVRLGRSGRLGWTTWLGAWRDRRPAKGVRMNLTSTPD
jgi:type VI secretion system protein ImpH